MNKKNMIQLFFDITTEFSDISQIWKNKTWFSYVHIFFYLAYVADMAPSHLMSAP